MFQVSVLLTSIVENVAECVVPAYIIPKDFKIGAFALPPAGCNTILIN